MVPLPHYGLGSRGLGGVFPAPPGGWGSEQSGVGGPGAGTFPLKPGPTWLLGVRCLSCLRGAAGTAVPSSSPPGTLPAPCAEIWESKASWGECARGCHPQNLVASPEQVPREGQWEVWGQCPEGPRVPLLALQETISPFDF